MAVGGRSWGSLPGRESSLRMLLVLWRWFGRYDGHEHLIEARVVEAAAYGHDVEGVRRPQERRWVIDIGDVGAPPGRRQGFDGPTDAWTAGLPLQ
jgi:hypothetical protein